MFNYTTTVPESKTIAEIEKILADFGARTIHKEYAKGGVVESLRFVILFEGSPIAFKLPANVPALLAAMKANPRVAGRLCNEEQARRVSWRVIKAWIQAQLTLIEAKQALPVEVFLPYAMDQDGESAYQSFVKAHQRRLGSGAPPREITKGNGL